MNSDEYHAIDHDKDSAHYGTCRFCGLDFGDHERACPCGIPDGYDDTVARGRQEDRVYGERP